MWRWSVVANDKRIDLVFGVRVETAVGIQIRQRKERPSPMVGCWTDSEQFRLPLRHGRPYQQLLSELFFDLL